MTEPITGDSCYVVLAENDFAKQVKNPESKNLKLGQDVGNNNLL